ncbi:unnamed protein product [Paramecium octaurelia]|uniref:Uncharacterized protein n=1 Tax=Paramecium octaurelia TaxID=43137 RepID=A0A8S1XJE4_PAROT|nr:unnamed protein product [Paramecium octaurelia]
MLKRVNNTMNQIGQDMIQLVQYLYEISIDKQDVCKIKFLQQQLDRMQAKLSSKYDLQKFIHGLVNIVPMRGDFEGDNQKRADLIVERLISNQ